MFNKRKWLTRLNQKVMEMGRAVLHSALVIRKSPGREQAPNPMNSNRRNAVTGPIQEVSLSNGWAETLLKAAERFDRAEQQLWK
jgi:hypothetical protein